MAVGRGERRMFQFCLNTGRLLTLAGLRHPYCAVVAYAASAVACKGSSV